MLGNVCLKRFSMSSASVHGVLEHLGPTDMNLGTCQPGNLSYIRTVGQRDSLYDKANALSKSDIKL